MTTPQNNPAATLAALCIFNGLNLSPVFASPDSRYQLAGAPLSPRFVQCRNYLSRFFHPSQPSPEDFAPLEVFNGAVAAAQWIRGAVGTLQHSLYAEHRIDVPDAAGVDPAAWFDELDAIAALLLAVEPDAISHELIESVMDAWQEPDIIPKYEDSRASFLSRYYAQARRLRDAGQMMTNAQTISRARTLFKLPEGRNLPIF